MENQRETIRRVIEDAMGKSTKNDRASKRANTADLGSTQDARSSGGVVNPDAEGFVRTTTSPQMMKIMMKIATEATAEATADMMAEMRMRKARRWREHLIIYNVRANAYNAHARYDGKGFPQSPEYLFDSINSMPVRMKQDGVMTDIQSPKVRRLNTPGSLKI